MPQEAIGFHAQQPLENILKVGFQLLASNIRILTIWGTLLEIIRGIPEERDTPAGEELQWLTRYAVRYRYLGAEIEMDDPVELHGVIARIVLAIEERIKELTGVEELPRYTRPTRRLSDDGAY